MGLEESEELLHSFGLFIKNGPDVSYVSKRKAMLA